MLSKQSLHALVVVLEGDGNHKDLLTILEVAGNDAHNPWTPILDQMACLHLDHPFVGGRPPFLELGILDGMPTVSKRRHQVPEDLSTLFLFLVSERCEALSGSTCQAR
jgi:hypothetical protein